MRRCASKSRAMSTDRSVNSRRCRSSLSASNASTFFMISASGDAATCRTGVDGLRSCAISDLRRSSSCDSSVRDAASAVTVDATGWVDDICVGVTLPRASPNARPTPKISVAATACAQAGSGARHHGRSRCATGTGIWNPSCGIGGVHTSSCRRVQPSSSISLEHTVHRARCPAMAARISGSHSS
jgi:hypothetical protein